MRREGRADARQSHGDRSILHAEVVALSGDEATKVQVRTSPDAGPSPCREATLALHVPYRPAVGDRVIVAPVGDELCVIGVVAAANPPEIGLAGGGAMRVREGAAEVVDPEGRVVVRYAKGALEIVAPSGDLTLAAPSGRVTVRSAEDIHLDAVRDITHSAGRSVETTAGSAASTTRLRVGHGATELDTKRLRVRARSSALTADEATLIAGRIATTAVRLTQEVELFELTAQRIVEKTRDVFRDASDLAQTRVGRARTVVKGLYALCSRRTTLASEEETHVDGSRILLG